MPSTWARALAAWAWEEAIDRLSSNGALWMATPGGKVYAEDRYSAGARLLDKSPDIIEVF